MLTLLFVQTAWLFREVSFNLIINKRLRKDKMAELERRCCIRGYHCYQPIWTAAVGEQFPCIREPFNVMDRYAVAVKKDGIVIGHLPKKVSRICSLFLRRERTIRCTVTGTRRYSEDLPQGGLEIPCNLLFSGKQKEIEEVKRLYRYTTKQ